ncbi:MAG: hypothetical protein IKK49_07950 [Clostridia bacterium]|nr:hypothetical protein [Clostridia bacterium]
MKKVLTSVLALLMAAIMVLTFAACGGNDEPETTTEAPVAESTDAVDATEAATEDATEAATEDATEAASEEATEAVDATEAASEAESTEAAEVVVPTDKAEIVALYNEATAKAVSAKPGFKKTVTTELQNLEMGAIGKLDMVRDAVGGFLGEGTETITATKGKASNEIVKSTLSAADVTAATCKLSADGKYYEVAITVKNETNPLKGKSALNKFTNDYKDVNEMHEGLQSEGASAEKITCTVKTATIKAKIAVADKSFSTLDYTVKIDALLEKVNYVLTVKQATGTIYTTAKFANFAY